MLESAVAAMVSLIFMSMGANLVIAANLQKIVAKRNIAMNNYVQSDLDGIKYQAKILDKNDGYCTNTTTSANGYAAALKAQLGADGSTNIKVMDRTYTMTRTTTVSDTDHRILKIAYNFTHGSDTTSQFSLYTELMPTEAASCKPT